VLKRENVNRRKRQSLLHDYTPEQILIMFWYQEKKSKPKYSAMPEDIYRNVANRLRVSQANVTKVVKKHYNFRSLRIERFFLRRLKIPGNRFYWDEIKHKYFLNYNINHNKRLHSLKKNKWSL